jgi:hypothetical protein
MSRCRWECFLSARFLESGGPENGNGAQRQRDERVGRASVRHQRKKGFAARLGLALHLPNTVCASLPGQPRLHVTRSPLRCTTVPQMSRNALHFSAIDDRPRILESPPLRPHFRPSVRPPAPAAGSGARRSSGAAALPLAERSGVSLRSVRLAATSWSPRSPVSGRGRARRRAAHGSRRAVSRFDPDHERLRRVARAAGRTQGPRLAHRARRAPASPGHSSGPAGGRRAVRRRRMSAEASKWRPPAELGQSVW